MKHLAVSQTLLTILMVILILTVHALREDDREITARLDMIEAKQNQLELQASGGWEPVDLTYLPRIRRNPELKQKNKKD